LWIGARWLVILRTSSYALFVNRCLPILVSFFSAIFCEAVPVKIACVGDSITQGAGLAITENYPTRLQRLLGSTNQYLVRNFGVGGRTLLKKGDFPYWKEPAFTNSQTFQPDIVIIQLGTNDGKPYNWIHGTNFISEYKEMIGIYAALSSAPKIFICTPCPVFGSGAFDINPGTIHTNIAPAVRSIATELSVPLIDLHVRLTNSAWFPDTVHPDTRGAAAMAAVMFENLSGGLPAGDRPTLVMQRTSSTRVILSWPTNWASLTLQMATSQTASNRWGILSTGVPGNDGTMIRQTNVLPIFPQRYFQLARP
jgi:lysophospholipase L1-like esterase